MKRLGLLASLLAVLGAASACSNTVEGLKEDAARQKLDEKAERAAEAVAGAVEEAGGEIRARTLALDVKATLMADRDVDASGLHVEADPDRRLLTLTGSVPTLAQKVRAGLVARSKSGDYQVRNLLRAQRS
jgi:osmotically-inducible protein OsmY